MNLNLHFFSTLDKGPALPVDSEAVSKCRKTTERVPNDLDNCNFRNEIIDTFTVDHLPYKLNSDSVKVISCLSLIEDVDLPYFEKYLKPPEKKKYIYNLYTSLRRNSFPRLYRQYYRTQNNSHRFTSLETTEKSNLYSNCETTVSKFTANLLIPFFGKKTI